MKTILFVLLGILCAGNITLAQDYVGEKLEKEPSFPGGYQEFMTYLKENIKYPKKAKRNNIEGKVFVQFVVEQDGSVSNVEIIRGLGYGCNEEVIRVIEASPKWSPGILNGEAVRVLFTLPVTFMFKKRKKKVK